jgi:hypothetical protein
MVERKVERKVDRKGRRGGGEEVRRLVEIRVQ